MNPVSADLLAAASLLIAVLAVLYGLWLPQAEEALDMPIPLHDRGPFKKKIGALIWSRLLPLFVGHLLLVAVLLPPAIAIAIRVANVAVEQLDVAYDAVQACYLLAVLFLLAMTIFTARIFFRAIRFKREISS